MVYLFSSRSTDQNQVQISFDTLQTSTVPKLECDRTSVLKANLFRYMKSFSALLKQTRLQTSNEAAFMLFSSMLRVLFVRMYLMIKRFKRARSLRVLSSPQLLHHFLSQYYHSNCQVSNLARYSVHGLRHLISVYLLEDGQGIEFVQDQLGHKNIKNTLLYSKISNPTSKKIYRELENSRKVVRLWNS